MKSESSESENEDLLEVIDLGDDEKPALKTRGKYSDPYRGAIL